MLMLTEFMVAKAKDFLPIAHFFFLNDHLKRATCCINIKTPPTVIRLHGVTSLAHILQSIAEDIYEEEGRCQFNS